MRLDLRELVLHVVGVHRLDLLARRCTEHLDDLHQLVDATLTREQRLAQHQLCHDTSRRPNIYAHDSDQHRLHRQSRQIDAYQYWWYSWSRQK
jgi:hypothetical protein